MNTPRSFDALRAPLALLTALSVASMATIATPAAAPGRPARDGTSTHRLALVIGSHEGGKGLERLLYSGDDAKAFRRTLEELGGLAPGEATLLIDPDSTGILRALDDMVARTHALKSDGARVEALVYYSGHADENGLRLGEQALAYRTFRNRLDNLGADVRIAVLDACESGALTRSKGGRNVPAFLVDQSTRSEGYAILTSSSENEAAQESDRIGGSYFTHALNSGLRGAADASQDGRVTLHEAYQFAYNETLVRTQSTRGGPQHAGYEMQLTGSGDVVLTDLREASSFLDLAKDLQGRIFIRDSAERLVAELYKPADSEMRLGLSAGTYGLRVLQGDRWGAGTVTLEDGKSRMVTQSTFQAAGNLSESAPTNPGGIERDSNGFHHVPPDGMGGFSSSLLYDAQKQPWHGTQLGPLATDARSHLRGGQISIGVNVVRGDLEGYQAAVGANIVGGSAHGVQISEINIVSDDLEGAQIGSLAGITGGNVRGAQGSGIFNIAGGRLQGWQGAGIFSITGDETKGAQLSGIFNVTGDSVRGAQAAGIFNVAGKKVNGGQGAGIFNAAGGDVRGVQGAGIFNVSLGTVRGVQGAGIFNASAGLHGFQVASIFNVTGKANGYQIGLINLSNEYESGVPIGLVNISRKGSFEGEAWIEETGVAFVGLRTGARWMHSHLAVGTKTLEGNRKIFAPTLGVSGEYALDAMPLFFEAGLLHSSMFELEGYALNDANTETDWSRVRIGLGYKPLSFVSLVGGLTYNVSVHPHSDEPITGTEYPFFNTYGNTVSLWPGAYIGIRIGK
jgi:hypothetical protein